MVGRCDRIGFSGSNAVSPRLLPPDIRGSFVKTRALRWLSIDVHSRKDFQSSRLRLPLLAESLDQEEQKEEQLHPISLV